jgi:3-oxoacyl-[acyl-carrier protein] reductase
VKLHLENRVVFVTGASSGIGRTTAIAFANEGARVAISYQTDRAAAEATAAGIEGSGEHALIVRLDLGDRSTIEAAVRTIVERWGGIDVLVNNAAPYGEYGFGDAPPFEQMPEQHWHRITRHALDGIFHATQWAIPHMRTRGWGRIVLVSSEVAEIGFPGLAAYGTAKAALHGLCRSLARELGPAGILVNVVMPGLVATEKILQETSEALLDRARRRAASGRVSTPEDVASAIVFLASGANGNITGEVVRVTGGGMY